LKAVAIALLFGVAAIAQVPQTFRTRVDAVQVDVLVTRDNRPVLGLTPEDFVVLDNGVAQPVEAMTIRDVPISFMLALDISSSVEGAVLRDLKGAAVSAMQDLEPRDRSALLLFSARVRLATPWTTDHDTTIRAIGGADSGGTTSLNDALYAALTLRDREPERRSIVLLFSDGTDTASWLPDSAILRKAERTDTVVYAVTLESRSEPRLGFRSGIELMPSVGRPPDPRELLAEITGATGGRYLPNESPRRLGQIFKALVAEFRTRYLLTYQPSGLEPGWHEIAVTLKDQRGDVKARRGYVR
jgi:VWFA-related protein